MSTEISGVGQPGFVERYGLDFGSGHGWDAPAEEVEPASVPLISVAVRGRRSVFHALILVVAGIVASVR